ncbi:MAG: heat-inducible transcriptional repressor HrcA [Bacilli bacterium]
MDLSRRELILKYIVEFFIKTATPVGSQTLLDEYDLSYSSATIRNEMNMLESEGFLEKTHTSSGRVPSSKGYRYYVDHLRGHSVEESVKMQIQTVLEEKTATVEEVIKSSCEILAHMTNLASVVLGPNASEEKLLSIQIIPINANTATAIFVTDQGYVENKTFVIPEKTNVDEVKKCLVILNDRLTGTPISDVIDKMDSLKPMVSDYVIEHTVIYQAFADAFLRFAQDRLSMYGKSSLLNQPEYKNDADKLKRLISLLDNKKQLSELLASKDQVSVKIGDADDDKDISVVTAKVRIPGHQPGTIAVMGQTRMDYDRIVSTLEYVVKELEDYFEDFDSESEDE